MRMQLFARFGTIDKCHHCVYLPPPCQLPPHIWGVVVTALAEPAPTPVPWLKTSVG